MKNETANDPIVDEVYAIRAEIAAECGYDIRRIAEQATLAAKKIPGLHYVSLEEIKQRRRSQLVPQSIDRK